jgi:hypothetical protein
MTVETAAGLNVSGGFALEQIPTTDPNEPGGYRVKFIGGNHVFLNTAESVESFTFSLAILIQPVQLMLQQQLELLLVNYKTLHLALIYHVMIILQ